MYISLWNETIFSVDFLLNKRVIQVYGTDDDQHERFWILRLQINENNFKNIIVSFPISASNVVVVIITIVVVPFAERQRMANS